MKSHFVHLLVYSTLVSGYFGALVRRRALDQFRVGVYIWLAMVLGVLALAWLMFPFPR